MFFIALFCFQISVAKGIDTYLWVQIESLTNKESIQNLIEFASQIGYSDLLVQVRSRDNAAYNSKIVSKPYFIKQDFDPLNYIIQLGGQKNIRIHAWINMYVIWSGKVKPKSSSHFLNQNEHWQDLPFNKKNNSNTNHYLSPIHPNVNSYLLSVINEVIENYKLDGVHLDYVRFKDKNYGNNNEGLQNFHNKKDDIIISQPENIEWDKFKINSVSALVQDAFKLVKNKNNKIILSASVKPNLLEAKNRFSQDWVTWLKKGYIDYVFPMNYYKEIEYFNRDLKLMVNRVPFPLQCKIVIGIGCYNQQAEDAVDKISLVKLYNFGGISLFSFDNHIKDLSWFKPLHKKLFIN